MPQPVIVNLRVGASADGSITVFSEAENAPTTNIIDAAYSLPVGALYNDPNNGTTGNNALFKFQGRTTAQGEEIIVGTYGDDFSTNVTVLTEYLASIMTNTLNCGIDTSDHANAEPFNESKYSGIAAYQTFNSLGDLTLATYAHYLFGHVQATAAISNDVAVVTYMNGNDPTDTTVQYTKPDGSTGTTGATKANIAYNLANTIINGLSGEAITTIVNNVIKQDASRARFEDNDLNNPDAWQHLVFKPDDVVFVQVTLDPPRLSFGSADQQYQNNVPNIEAITYNFRIAMTENGGLVDDSGNGSGTPLPTNISVTSTTASASLTAATSYRFTNNTNSTIIITLLNNGTPIAGSPVTLTIGQTSSAITGASSYTVTTPPPPNLYYEAFVYKGLGDYPPTVNRTYYESQMGASIPTSWWQINQVPSTNSQQIVFTDHVNGVLTSTAMGLPNASGTSTRVFMINNSVLIVGFTYSTYDGLFVIEWDRTSKTNLNYILAFQALLTSGTTYNVGTATVALLLPNTADATKGFATVNTDLTLNTSTLQKGAGFVYFSETTYGTNDVEFKFTLDNSTNANKISGGLIRLGFSTTNAENVSFGINIDTGGIESMQASGAGLGGTVECQFYRKAANKGLLNYAGHTLGLRYVASTRLVTLYNYTLNINVFDGFTPDPNNFSAPSGEGAIKVHASTNYKAWINSELSMALPSDAYSFTNISLNNTW